MILLVHSCDSREWLWKHWKRYFEESEWDIIPVFITETKKVLWTGKRNYLAKPFGKVPFSTVLIKCLEAIGDNPQKAKQNEYIWYTLDDYFIVEPIDWKYYESLVIHLHADVLRLQPNVQVDSLPYRFEKHGELLKQRPDSAYTMTMQTSIWRREYFLECLTPGMDPWEVEATKPKLGNVYFVPRLPFWYVDTVRRGEILEKHKGMFDEV